MVQRLGTTSKYIPQTTTRPSVTPRLPEPTTTRRLTTGYDPTGGTPTYQPPQPTYQPPPYQPPQPTYQPPQPTYVPTPEETQMPYIPPVTQPSGPPRYVYMGQGKIYDTLIGEFVDYEPWMEGQIQGQISTATTRPTTGTAVPATTPTPTTPTTPTMATYDATLAALGLPAGAYDLSNLMKLLRPSMQYWARMGPTAQQQYAGYEQARIGITPEELQFRQWSMAPPTGLYPGLTYRR